MTRYVNRLECTIDSSTNVEFGSVQIHLLVIHRAVESHQDIEDIDEYGGSRRKSIYLLNRE